ncbi:MAG: AAA family ATPase [Clostridiales bacterium]|nr:AAA family ATPase [Clostridiales bacterium]
MFIKNITIGAFGAIENQTIDFEKGVNIIEGANESGKSTICAFIKFMFYGLSAKGAGGLSERKKYMPFDANCVFGTLTLHTGGTDEEGEDYLIERRMTLTGKTAAKDEYRIMSLATGKPAFEGMEPCDAFLSMSEGLFLRTVYVSQKMGTAVDGKEITTALENLLFSAEESVDSAKALKELDAVRVDLLHKNAKGGRLYEARVKRDELIAALEQTKRAKQELATEEEQLRRLIKSETENQRLTNEAQQKIEQYNQATLLMSFAKLHQYEQKQEALRAKREKLTPHAGLPKTEEIHTAIRLASELRTSKQELARLQEEKQKREQEALLYQGASSETNDIPLTVSSLTQQKKGAARAKAAGLFALLAGLAACVGGLFFRNQFHSGAGAVISPWILWSVGAVLLLAGLVFMVIGAKQKRALKQWLTKHGAASIDEWQRQTEQAQAASPIAAEIAAIQNQMADKQVKVAALENNAAALCQKYDSAFTSPDSLDDLAVRLTAVKENCLSLEGEIQQIEKAKEELRASLCEEDEEALKQALPAPPETILQSFHIKDLKNRLTFGTEAQESIRAKRGELETALAAKRASLADEETLQAEIEEQTALIGVLTLRYNAVKLACDSIEEAALRVKSNVSPALAARASELMCLATKEKYTKLWIADDVSMTYQGTGGFMRSIDYLSQGTKDLAYIALRIALCETLSQDKQMPMIFDEAFSALDDQRLKQMLAVIAQREGQTLLFTSQARDRALQDNANMITLSQ